MSKLYYAGAAAMVVFVMTAAVGAAGFVGVDPGVEKVTVERGELTAVKGQGWYWLNPVTTDTHKVSVRPQIYVQSGMPSEGEQAGRDDSIESKTVDGNIVFVDVAIRYQVEDSRTFYLNWYHDRYGRNPFLKFEDEKLRSPSRDLVRDIVGTINSEDVYTGESQQEIEVRLEETLVDELRGSGVSLIGVDMRNIRFSGEYQTTLEQKANSVQQRDIQSNLAEADAEAQVIRAQGDADATRIRAEGNRDADRIRKEELSGDIITIRQIEAYDNANTVYVPVGSDGLPMFVEAGAQGQRNSTSEGAGA